MSLQDYKGIFIFAELVEGTLHDVVPELIGEGKRLANELGTTVTAVILGDGSTKPYELLSNAGADEIIAVWKPELQHYLTESYTYALEKIISQRKPDIFLFGATPIGRDLAPRLSARIRTGLTADCTKLEINPENKNLLMTRPAFGGNLMATIICEEHRPQMATVRSGVMQRITVADGHKATITEIPMDLPKDRVEVLDTVHTPPTKMNIGEAKVLVSGGRGIGGASAFHDLERIADLLGGTIASSRAAVDSNWADKDRQVGQTGRTVRPDLYIACGISGAIQHLAGMEESELIIAINKDETAPIFQIADLGIVGNLTTILPELEKLLKSDLK